MSSSTNTNKDGFTIIEVLIVLGIAGMIFSLTFLAVPTLVRNGRNNERKQDVAIVLQSISRYMLNHTANFPEGPAASDQTSATYFLQSYKLSGYSKGNVIVQSPSPQNAYGPLPSSDIERVVIYAYAKCNKDQPGAAVGTNADYRDVVALYLLESSNSASPTPKCEQM